MPTQPIDYAALAKQAGGSSAPAPGASEIDYAALAKQAGASVSVDGSGARTTYVGDATLELPPEESAPAQVEAPPEDSHPEDDEPLEDSPDFYNVPPKRYGRDAQGNLVSHWDGTNWRDLFNGKKVGPPASEETDSTPAKGSTTPAKGPSIPGMEKLGGTAPGPARPNTGMKYSEWAPVPAGVPLGPVDSTGEVSYHGLIDLLEGGQQFANNEPSVRPTMILPGSTGPIPGQPASAELTPGSTLFPPAQAQGATKMVSGAMGLSAPVALAGGILAPGEAFATLAIGTAAEKGTSAGLTQMGVAPEYADLAGQVAAFAAMGIGGKRILDRLDAVDAAIESHNATAENLLEAERSKGLVQDQIDQVFNGEAYPVQIGSTKATLQYAQKGLWHVVGDDGKVIYAGTGGDVRLWLSARGATSPITGEVPVESSTPEPTPIVRAWQQTPGVARPAVPSAATQRATAPLPDLSPASPSTPTQIDLGDRGAIEAFTQGMAERLRDIRNLEDAAAGSDVNMHSATMKITTPAQRIELVKDALAQHREIYENEWQRFASEVGAENADVLRQHVESYAAEHSGGTGATPDETPAAAPLAAEPTSGEVTPIIDYKKLAAENGGTSVPIGPESPETSAPETLQADGGTTVTNSPDTVETLPAQAPDTATTQTSGLTPAKGEPGWEGKIPTGDIKADPVRFQFKQKVGQGGAGDELRDVTNWNPEMGGMTLVWKDPSDDQTYIVNGHNRLALANRLGVPQLTVHYLDANSAEEARTKGAMVNIGEGRGEATDAAKVFRDSGMTPADLEQNGVAIKGKLAKQGMALANLAPPLFNDVVSGDLSVERGVVIGAGLPNQADQAAVYDLIKQREKIGKRPTDDQVEELIRLNNRTPTVTRSSADQAQGGLFGVEEMTQSLLPEKAEVSDYVRKQLASEKKLFGVVGTQGAADKLSQTGNVIQVGQNAAQAAQANQGILLYDKLSGAAGPVDALLNRAAQSLAAGEPSGEVKQRAYRAVREELTRQVNQLTGVPQVGNSAPQGLNAQGTDQAGSGEHGNSAPAAAVSPSATFTTSQGSTYAVNGDSTTRTKTPHVGHDPNDVGVKPPSAKTVYVDPKFATEVGMWNSLSAKGKRIVLKDGKVTLTSANAATGKQGRDPLVHDSSFTTEPAVGRAPLELFEPNAKRHYLGNHPGNTITAISGPSESVAQKPQAASETPVKTAFVKGDKVRWTGKKGEALTGSIRYTDSEDGTATIDTDQIMHAGGVPIGRIETVPMAKLEKAEAASQPAPQPGGSAAAAAGLSPQDIVDALKKKLAEQTKGRKPESPKSGQPEAAPPTTREEAIKRFQVGDRVTFPNFGRTITGTVEKLLPGGEPSKIPGVGPSKPTLQVRIEKEEGLKPGEKGATIGGLTGVDPMNAAKVGAAVESPALPLGLPSPERRGNQFVDTRSDPPRAIAEILPNGDDVKLVAPYDRITGADRHTLLGAMEHHLREAKASTDVLRGSVDRIIEKVEQIENALKNTPENAGIVVEQLRKLLEPAREYMTKLPAPDAEKKGLQSAIAAAETLIGEYEKEQGKPAPLPPPGPPTYTNPKKAPKATKKAAQALLDEAKHASKANEIWHELTANQRDGIAWGLFPNEVMKKAVAEGYDNQRLAAALMQRGKAEAPAPVNPFAAAADEARERLRAKMRRAKGEEPGAVQSRDPNAPPVDPEDLMGLATIGMQHMVDGATEWNEWTQRVMADVGDLVDWIAEGSKQSADDVLREVHSYAAAAVKDSGYDVAPAPAKEEAPAVRKPGDNDANVEATYQRLRDYLSGPDKPKATGINGLDLENGIFADVGNEEAQRILDRLHAEGLLGQPRETRKNWPGQFYPFIEPGTTSVTPQDATKRVPQPGDRVMVNLHSGMNDGYGTVVASVEVRGKPGFSVRRDNGELRDLLAQDVTLPQKPAPGVIGTYDNAEDGYQTVVSLLNDGQYSVVVRDTDSGEYLGTALMYSDEQSARTKAKAIAEGKPGAMPKLKHGGAPALIDAVYNKLKAGESLGNITELNKLAERHFGASRTSGQWTPKDAFDAMEAGINKYLLERGKDLMAMDPIAGLKELRGLMDRITSQAGVRTGDQLANQQFSTPPTESYVAARVAALKPSDVVLEPSAGNGGLAVWPKAIGAEVHVNEISERRAQMLEAVGFGTPTAHDGELINALLDPSVKPSVVLMNPPFSASTLKSHEAKNRSQYGFNHVDQALQRLAPNGRLVVILGGGHANDSNGGASLSTGPSGKWFAKIASQYNVRANIRISGKEYQKYGTTFATRIIVIDKDGPTPSQTAKNAVKTWASVKQGNVETLEEAYNLLRDVADSRPQIEPLARGGNSLGQRESGTGLVTDQGHGNGSDAGLAERGQGTGDASAPAVQQPGIDDSRSGGVSGGQGDQPAGGVQSGDQSAEHPATTAVGTPEGGVEHADTQRGLQLETNQEPAEADSESESDQGPFVTYHPTLAGPAHPGDIVETRTMATVPMPAITYKPALPPSVLENGALSAVQLEAIAIAGQQNAIVLPGGAYGSALIGDGTGVGKGRIAAGILWDNYLQGRKRVVWVSEKWDLMQDAIRDLRGLGATDLLRGITLINGKNVMGPNAAVIRFDKFKGGQEIKHDGELFSTYALIRSENDRGARRVDQLEQYLRGDDDGEGAYLLFDESHNLKNAVGPNQSEIGNKVKELLDRMPKLRTASLSATAATDVINLGYLDRLGLWGPGTAFPQGFGEFQTQIAPGGIAAMELIARELKAQGKYVSRTLSYKGVTYSQEKHELTPEQKDLYRTAAKAWASVVEQAEATIRATTNGGPRQVGRFMAAFGGAQQRFFNLLITALKTPTAVSLANQALADGKSVVITLVNTNEAAQNREKAKGRASDEDKDEPPDFDFGPKEMLVQLVRDNYPTQQYKDDVDSDGKPIKVPMYRRDAQGRNIPVENPSAVAERDALIAQLDRDLHMPENPLDILINSLGGENKVAEMTGRKEKYDASTGKFVTRGDPKANKDEINLYEMQAFQGGKKRVAVLSSAAGTGISLHAANDAANQQKRYHITLQVGWSADKAMQMLGRTHRTNQAQPPEYVMLTSDLGGEQRFVSTIARRLGSLGALTKGQKNAAAGSAVEDNANLETDQGRAATNSFYNAALRNVEIPGTGLTGMQVLTDLRVLKMVQGVLTVPAADKQNVTKLLNRLLALDPDVQNPTYKYFFNIFEAAVQDAIAAGTLDTGVKTLPGDEIAVKEQRAIAKDPATGAETYYYPVDAKIRTDRVSPEELEDRLVKNQARNPAILRDEKGKLLLAMDAPPIVGADGSVTPASYFAKPDHGKFQKIPQYKLRNQGYQEVGAWATAQVASARSKVADAEWRAEHDRQEMERSQKYQRDEAVRYATMDLREAQRALDESKALSPEMEFGATRNQRLSDIVAARQADLEKAQKTELPANDWHRLQLSASEKNLAEERESLAEAEALAANPQQWAKDRWKEAYDAAPSHTTREHHLIGGAVMRYWNPIRDAAHVRDSIYTTSDSKTGQRVVGIDIPATHIRALLDRITGGKSTVDAKQLHDDVLKNNMQYALESNIQVRRGSISRQPVIQLIPPNQDVGRALQGMGVLYERGVQPIYYVPSQHTGPFEKQTAGILAKVLKQYPVKANEAGPGAMQSRTAGGDGFDPASVPETDQPSPVQARPLPGDQPLFSETEEAASRAADLSNKNKLLGDRLTAQLRSGMAAKPAQLKPQSGPRGLFEDEAPQQGGLFSRAIPGFYSQLERVIDAKVKGPQAPGQLLAMLRNPQNGVKADELKWSGIETFLEGRKEPVTKQQLMEYVKANNVRVEEKMLGRHPANPARIAKMEAELAEVEAEAVRAETKAKAAGAAVEGDRVATIGSTGQRGGYSYYGGKVYQAVKTKDGRLLWRLDGTFGGERSGKSDRFIRELKASAPAPWLDHVADKQYVREGGTDQEAAAEARRLRESAAKLRASLDRAKQGVGTPVKYPTNWQLPGGVNQRELVLFEPKGSKTEPWGEDDDMHYGDVGKGRTVGWIRFNDRTGASGERIMHVEEFQDKRRQEGRERGYAPAGSDFEAVKREVEQRYGLNWNDSSISALEARGADPAFIALWEAAVNGTSGITVPPAPFAKTWPELLFRRALRHAVENGYDAMTWTTGAQQAERYDLSKQVDSIHYSPEEQRLWAVKDGNNVINVKADPSTLADYIGKEAARNILKAPVDAGTHDRQSLSGLDLKVGGEGMNGFYDKILPAYANKYGKQWGVKVGETKLKGIDEPVHSIPITPQMRESVMTGQPLFARKSDPNQGSLFDERSTSQATLATPRGPRPLAAGPTPFTVNPQSVARLKDAPVPVGPLATPEENTAFWGGTDVRGEDLGGRPALFVNVPGMEVVLRRMGPAGIGQSAKNSFGLTLEPEEWMRIVNAAQAAAANPRAGGFDDALIHVASEIANLMAKPENAAKPAESQTLIVAQAGQGMSDAALKRVAEEEHDHALQMELPGGLSGLPVELVDTASGQKAAAALVRVGYPALVPGSKFYDHNKALIAAEIGVRLMRPGRWQELDLTAQEAGTLANQYSERLLAKPGATADAIARQIYDSIPEANTNDETGLGRVQGEHAAPAEGKAGSGEERRAGPDVSGLATGESSGAGSETAVAPEIKAPLQSRGERGSIRASILTTPVTKAFDFLRGAGDPEEPERNYSGLGAFQDKFVRNLSQLDKSKNESVHAAAVQLATSRAQSSALLRAAAPRVEAALTKDGPSWTDFRRALIESRLRGLRERWSDMADATERATDKELKEEFGKWTLHLLKNIRPADEEHAPPQSPAETAVALLQQDDMDGLRAFAADAFRSASDRVARIMPEDEFDKITKNPHFDAGLKTYKKLLEQPIARNHEENEGVFSNALGPLDTYYPLIPMTDGEVTHAKVGRSGRAVPYRKPRNIANAFATGLSEDYSADMDALGDRLANAFRVNNKAALMQALVDSNLSRKLKRGEEVPDTITVRGVEYKAAVVETSPDKVLITPQGTVNVPAGRMLIPAWLEDELRPILDRRNINLVNPHGLMALITKYTLAGPLDAVIHSANLMGTLVANTPFLGRNLTEKAVGNFPFTKRAAALFIAMTTDPHSEEAAQDIQAMAKLGILPEKYGSTASGWFKSGRKYAEQTGAELSYGFGPALYGPGGIDVRARLMMYRAAKAINPDATPKEMYHFVNQLGNYTRALQGKLERGVKESGWSPFYTAGSTMVRNGVNAWLGTGPTITPGGGKGPGGKKGRAAMKALQALTGGAVGLIALWMAIHKKYTGKWPWEDPHAKFLSVRLNEEDRKSDWATALYGPPASGDGYVDIGFFSPLVKRGANALGVSGWFNAAQAGGSFDQKMEAAMAGAVDAAVQPLVGPPAKAAWIGLTGTEPHVTGWRDDRGKPMPQFMPAVKAQAPGAAGWGKQHAIPAVASMNSLFSNLAAATGLTTGIMPNADEQNNRWMRMVVDLAAPQLFSHPTDTLAHAEFLARQREGAAQTERVDVKRQLTDLLRDGKDDEARELIQREKDKISEKDVKEALQRSMVPKSVSGYSSLSLEPAIEILQIATPEEKAQFLPILMKKMRSAYPTLPEDEQRHVDQMVEDLHLTDAEIQAAATHQ